MKWVKKILSIFKKKKKNNYNFFQIPGDPTSDSWDEQHFGDHSIF